MAHADGQTMIKSYTSEVVNGYRHHLRNIRTRDAVTFIKEMQRVFAEAPPESDIVNRKTPHIVVGTEFDTGRTVYKFNWRFSEGIIHDNR